MSFADESKAIELRLDANWGSTTPIKSDNVDYTPVTGTTYIELQIHNAQGVRVTIGTQNPLYRYPGIISINIYGSLNEGTRTLLGYADSIADIFRGATFSNLICRTPKITRIGELDGWFVYNVSIPFHRDKTETT